MNLRSYLASRTAIVVTILLIGALAGCLPVKERPLDLNVYYDAEVNGKPMVREQRGFSYSTRSYDMLLDLGDGTIDWAGVMRGKPFIELRIYNSLDEPIHLDWDDSFFVLQSGTKTRLIDFDTNLTYLDRPFEPERIDARDSRLLIVTTPAAFTSDPEFMFFAGPVFPIVRYAGQGPLRANPLIDTAFVREFGMIVDVETPSGSQSLEFRFECNAPPKYTVEGRLPDCPTVRD